MQLSKAVLNNEAVQISVKPPSPAAIFAFLTNQGRLWDDGKSLLWLLKAKLHSFLMELCGPVCGEEKKDVLIFFIDFRGSGVPWKAG